MVNKNTKCITKKKQVEKNQFINKNKPEIKNFLYHCKSYTRKVSFLKNSPWSKKANPIYVIKQMGFTKIGKNQKKLIYFLHDFFKNGRPVYFNYNTIAARLEINPTNIAKVIKSLEDCQLVVRENFKSVNKGGQHQVILLPNFPNNPLAYQIFLEPKLLDQNKVKYLSKQIKFLCKRSKLKNFLLNSSTATDNTSIYYNTYKPITNKFLTKLIEAPAVASKSSVSVCPAKEKKIMRLNLKRQSTNHLPPPLKKSSVAEKFKRRKQPLDKQKTIEQLDPTFVDILNRPLNELTFDSKLVNQLNRLLETQYGFEYNLNSLISLKNFDSFAGRIDIKTLFRFFELLKKDGKLEILNTVKIIEYFNNKNNRKFSKTNSNFKTPTKTFKKLVVSVSYFMSIGHTVDDFRKAIDRLHNYSHLTKFKYKNKINILEFLVNPYNEKYLQVFLKEEKDGAIFSALKEFKTKYPKEQEIFKKMFLEFYYDEEEGLNDYKCYSYRIKGFVEETIDDLVINERDRCGYKLFYESNDGIHEPVMEMYLNYIVDNTGRDIPMVKDIVSPKRWLDFVENYMCEEEEAFNFWKICKKPV